MAETHHFHAHKLFNMKDYVCVITGGGSGIGLMAAQALSANGARVYITGRRAEAIETAANEHTPSTGQIIALPTTDVTSKQDLEKCVAAVEKQEKHINLLICAAGISSAKVEPAEEDAVELAKKLWENESFEDWGSTFNTNVSAVYFSTVAFLPLLQAGIKSGQCPKFGPSVITISSMSGQIRDAQGHFAYNASKAATVHLTKLMSAEFQKTGIRCNSIAPGYFSSEMTTDTSDDRQKSQLAPEKIQEKGHVPLARAGRDEEMGMTVLFLAKNEYVNGQILTVDGGVLNVLSS